MTVSCPVNSLVDDWHCALMQELIVFLFQKQRQEKTESCPFNVREHVPSQSQVDFECSFQKTKNSRLFFSIFNTITPA